MVGGEQTGGGRQDFLGLGKRFRSHGWSRRESLEQLRLQSISTLTGQSELYFIAEISTR
jgi:hypothetical protein